MQSFVGRRVTQLPEIPASCQLCFCYELKDKLASAQASLVARGRGGGRELIWLILQFSVNVSQLSLRH